ncbi:MAG: hypothetical protein AB7D28_06710 [Candidatus Berkiella sp.]
MSKLIVCALMGMSVFFVGSASAQSLTVNEGIASTCDASVLYKQYVCQGGLVDAVQRYDELFKPPAAYLNPVVSDDKGGGIGGGGAFSNIGSGGSGGGDSSNEDFMSDGFQ